jgi:hypothetical protein
VDLCPQPRTEPHVLVVQVHVDELTQLTFLVEQSILEAGEPSVERRDGCAEVCRLDVHGGLPFRETPQRAGDPELSHF